MNSRMSPEAVFKAGRLCVVGNINRDLKTAPLRPGDYLFQDGETSVSSIVESVGGGGANTAFAAASLGAKVAFLGKVGTDALGRRLEQTLIQHGITAHLARDRAHPTGTSIALAFQHGHRHFVSCLPNSQSLSFEDLSLAALRSVDHLLRADVWFSEAMLFGGNEKLFQIARESGLAVSLDLNWDPQWGRAAAATIRRRKQAVRSLLPWVNLAHGNVRELNEFADSTDLKTTLSRLEKWGVEAVVIHLGARGAGYYQKGKLLVEPPVRAKGQINTTGTGDVLSVCMMLLHRQTAMPIRERLSLANAIVTQFIEGKRQLIPPLC
jgi:sugar/nucleoside kinase (ribokinase family)